MAGYTANVTITRNSTGTRGFIDKQIEKDQSIYQLHIYSDLRLEKKLSGWLTVPIDASSQIEARDPVLTQFLSKGTIKGDWIFIANLIVYNSPIDSYFCFDLYVYILIHSHCHFMVGSHDLICVGGLNG